MQDTIRIGSFLCSESHNLLSPVISEAIIWNQQITLFVVILNSDDVASSRSGIGDYAVSIQRFDCKEINYPDMDA